MQEPYTIPCATFMLLQSYYSARNPSCANTCPTVSWSRCQRDSHHNLVPRVGRIKDVPRVTEVASPGQFHKRQTNSHRRVPCDTICRSPIFMHLPAPVLQTLCGLRPIPTAASCQKRHSSVCWYWWKTLCAEKIHLANEVFGFWLVSSLTSPPYEGITPVHKDGAQVASSEEDKLLRLRKACWFWVVCFIMAGRRGKVRYGSSAPEGHVRARCFRKVRLLAGYM